jgi:enediyne biosynthesis protein E4
MVLPLLAAALLWIWITQSSRPEDASSQPAKGPTFESPSAKGAVLAAREDEADRTYWAKEILAEKCGRVFETLWDSVNAATNKFAVIGLFAVPEITLPSWEMPQHLPHGIELVQSGGRGLVLSQDDWRKRLQGLEAEGWKIDNLEFRHIAFDTTTNGQPLQSRFYFAARLTRPVAELRAIVEGDLIVDWASPTAGEDLPSIKRIDASRLKAVYRAGAPFFEPVQVEEILPRERSSFIDPLILHDLDGDGLSEILLPGNNVIYHRQPSGQYLSKPLCRFPVDHITAALVADFVGDGFADLLCANYRGLYLFKGSRQGTFEEAPELAWPADPALKNAMALTCGDIDGDGDLDVFLGQYRVPTLAQVLRPFYYDANDGWPAHLLLNDGHGRFTDATETSGLAAKRARRVYCATLADLDGDGNLDLAVISDFAGLDLYRNDGHGHFTDATQQWVAQPHAFGMADALSDFNDDGRLDLLMIGMGSATADRLGHLGLWRPYSPEDRAMRPAMTFGNRLFLGRLGGGFEQSALGDSIARSGWSWGCSAFDLDNDGYPDLYVGNGLETKESVRDYESEFWLHDMFIGPELDDVTVSGYFMDKHSRTRGSGWSYGGYEKNRLYLNQAAQSFLEIGQLAGAALEQDTRNVVSDDLDGDGRVDLVATTLEAFPKPRQTLQIYRNRMPDSGHWIGFRFKEGIPGHSPVGAKITLAWDGHKAIRQLVAGDSHRSQHASTVHFGLGTVDRVGEAVIQWTDGSKTTLTNPIADRYHNPSRASEASAQH